MVQLNWTQLRPASLSSRLTAAHGMVSRESRELRSLEGFCFYCPSGFLFETNVSSLFYYYNMRNITHHIRGKGCLLYTSDAADE